MAEPHEPENENTGRRAILGADLDTTAAKQHLHDLAAVIPGAFYRFRCNPDGEYSLDFMTEGIGGLNELARAFELTSFKQWIQHIPERYHDSFLQSIARSRREMTPWVQEFPVDTPGGRIWLQGISTPHAESDGSIVWNGLVLDVTEGKRAALELQRAQTDYHSIFENTTEGIYRASQDGRLLDVNKPLVDMHGCSSKEALINAISDIATDWYVDPDDRKRFIAELDRHGHVENFQSEIYCVGTGERIWVQENSRAIHDTDGNLLYYQGTVRDITDDRRARRLSERRAELLELIARGQPVTQVLYEVVGTIESYRPRVTVAILGLDDELIQVAAAPGLSNTCIQSLHGKPVDRIGGAVASAMNTYGLSLQSKASAIPGDSANLPAAMKDGGYADLGAICVCNQDDMVLGFLTVFTADSKEVDEDLRGLLREMAQITAIALEQDRLSRRLIEQARHDNLTGLPNRMLLADRMQQAMHNADRNNLSVAILLLDLDGFKQVNDTMGHDAGDALLKEVAQRLESCVRATDTVARFGGDEFVIVLPLDEPDRVEELVARIFESVVHPARIQQQDVQVQASIGVSMYSQDASTADNLTRAADLAMYAAKKAGRNQHRFFNTSMDR